MKNGASTTLRIDYGTAAAKSFATKWMVSILPIMANNGWSKRKLDIDSLLQMKWAFNYGDKQSIKSKPASQQPRRPNYSVCRGCWLAWSCFALTQHMTPLQSDICFYASSFSTDASFTQIQNSCIANASSSSGGKVGAIRILESLGSFS